jgi:hypothetical protein
MFITNVEVCRTMFKTTLLDTFTEFMYNTNENNILEKIIFIKWGNKIFWVAAISVGRSERGNKQNFILGLVKTSNSKSLYWG